MVFQYPLTKTLSAGIEIGTQAADVFCPNSLSPKYAHIWVSPVGHVQRVTQATNVEFTAHVARYIRYWRCSWWRLPILQPAERRIGPQIPPTRQTRLLQRHCHSPLL